MNRFWKHFAGFFLASLCVTNATLLRKTIAILLFSILSFDSVGFYGFVNQGGKADAVTPKSNTKRQAAASQSKDSIAGKWLSEWGLVEFNSNLTGQWHQGAGIGQIKDGTYDPKTRKLVFHYYQPWNDMTGTATLTLSEDGGQLSGSWTQQRGSNPTGSGGSGGWTMKRATPVTTTPKSDTERQAAASQANASIAGKWQSDWGTVEFSSSLTGQWDQGVGIGQIKDGTYDPKTRKLVFHYYQPWNKMDGTATLTLSEDGGQLSGSWTQQRGSNPTGSGGSGGWTMKRASATDVKTSQCPRFKTMLREAEDIRKLADTLEKDDKAYNAAVIDIVRKRYNSPYAVYMLDVPPEEILELFKDNQQVRAVRSQIISRIRTKADNRKQFADIGINGQFRPQTPIYSKENIELFCTLDSSKFTSEFWDSLWMAGYIDYNLYTETENLLIVYSRKDYFKKLAAASAELAAYAFTEGAYFFFKDGIRFFLSRLEMRAIGKLEAETLPEATIEEVSVLSKESYVLKIDKTQLQKKFEKHAKDFGIKDNWNPQNGERFKQALENHVNSPETQVIVGTFKKQPVIHYVNPKTGLEVMTDPSGNFISGWKLETDQLRNVLTRGSL